jgi:hypothetical protein
LLPPAGCDLNAALLQLTKPRLTASTWSVNGGALMSSLCRSIGSLHRFDTRLPKLLLRFLASGGTMDFIYLAGTAVMFIAILGMVIACDKLGVRK